MSNTEIDEVRELNEGEGRAFPIKNIIEEITKI